MEARSRIRAKGRERRGGPAAELRPRPAASSRAFGGDPPDALGVRLELVTAGEEIVITRRGAEVARLVPAGKGAGRQLGIDRGRYTVPDDFDAPLPDEELAAFER
jgi:antitoxin (DNA-binding transcriptional repressor) of toxin-antitoxin stability system